MKEVIYKEEKLIDIASLLNLYNNAGWSNYTRDLVELEKAIRKSLYVLTAREDKKLVGLIRVVGDGLTIIYIQDILVLKSHKRQKIGSYLINKVLEKFQKVRHKVLLTDDNRETRGFYKSLGFESCVKHGLVSFVKFK